MNTQTKPRTALCENLDVFWKGLQESNGERARLKRCKNLAQVMMTPSYCRVYAKNKELLVDKKISAKKLAAIVGLLSHVKVRIDDTNEKLTKLMAQSQGGRPLVSELRFRRLLQRDIEDLYPALIRILGMLNGKANLYELIDSVMYWGDSVKKKWAFDYFPRLPE